MEHFTANADVKTVGFQLPSRLLAEFDYPIQDPTLLEERLYFFQFPCPFPEFTQKPTSPPSTNNELLPDDTHRKVAFSEGVKMEQNSYKSVESSKESKNLQLVDGIIGRLEIHRSGAVKMRLANGIILDVCAV